MKLITEDNISTFDVEEVINEATGKKDLYVKGIFMQAEKKNRNGRLYPSKTMENEVNRYIKEYVNTNKAYGELNHPPSTKINPDRISHLITELKKVGDDYVGKAKILNTDAGNTIRAIVEAGGAIGMSSRAVGSLKEENGVKIVQEDFRLCCVDAVLDPSAHDAWVNGIYESADFELVDGSLVETKINDKKEEEVSKTEEEDEEENNKKEAEITESKIKSFESFMDKLVNF